jgi:molybdopterin converting factor small subunit
LIADRVAQLGFSPQTVSDFEKRLYRAAYPKHMVCLRQLITEPYQCDVTATAFRETNVGSEKELENSVLWKAVQALGTLIDSLKRDIIAARFEDIEVGVASARRQGGDDTEILDDLLVTVRHLNLYHPIVVIEAPLWLVGASGQLLRISACRFEQVQACGGFSRWVDIVHRPQGAFKKAGAKPF